MPNSRPDRVYREIGSQTGYWIAGVAALVVVLIFASFAFGFWSKTTAEERGSTDQREQTIANGTYRIANYDRFFNQCAAVEAKEAQITRARRDLPPNPDVIDRDNLSALENSRSELITQYNADSSKEDTAAAFKSSRLPYKLDENGVTQCAG